jgi:hypothetical protein
LEVVRGFELQADHHPRALGMGEAFVLPLLLPVLASCDPLETILKVSVRRQKV